MSPKTIDKTPAVEIDLRNLTEPHIDRLYRFALVRVRDTGTAEDLVQETLLAAIQSSGRFTGSSSAATWLTGILKHKIIDHYRRQRVFVDIDNGEETFDETGRWRSDAAPLPWSSRTPDDDLQSKQLGTLLRQAMCAVPRPLATVFALREIEGLDRAEICELLGLSESNYWTMMHRARLRLRHEVEKRLRIASPAGSVLAPAV